ncbi:MAG: HAD family phosphatase [Alistipes sp.]|nr:HAD family phosphatase [Alistipes sp.]
MKNIVFDLGGVLFARNVKKCTQEFIDFFAFVRRDPMPHFWEEYDRGASTLEEVTGTLCEMHGCSRAKCEEFLRRSIEMQEPVEPTEKLVRDLKAAGYGLYVLSNMSCEFIEFLRRFPVYGLFDGEVVSCEEHTVKPERRIYEILLDRYGLDPRETLFVDDRPANIAAAERLGIKGKLFDAHHPETTCRELRELLLKGEK